MGKEANVAASAKDRPEALLPKNVLLAYVAKSPSLRTPSAGYTFAWKQNGYTIAIERTEERLRKRDLLVGDHAFDQKITSNICGYEIVDAVA